MEVNFVSTTSPSKDLQEKGVKTAEDLIVYCARVSNPKNQLNVGTGSKLLKYCVNHGHWSIFEQADMCLEIKTSRAISAQILRHKSFSPQEFCISGDTDVSFDMPCGNHYSIKIADLYRKFHEGAKPILQRKLKWDLSGIDSNKEYIPSELTKIIYTGNNKNYVCNVRSLCQKGFLKHTKKNGVIHILGSDVIDFYNNRETKTVVIPLRERIMGMRLRTFNPDTKEIEHTSIKDVFYNGKKHLYEVTLECGRKIKCTKEHKFLNSDYIFTPLENIVNLKIDSNYNVVNFDKERIVKVNGVPVYRNKEWLIQAKKESLFHGGGLKYISEKADISVHTIRAWLKKHNICYNKKEVSIIAGGSWNKGKGGYKLPRRTMEHRKARSEKTLKGVDSPYWRGGGRTERMFIGDYINKYRREIYDQNGGEFCSDCGCTDQTLFLHHVEEVTRNPHRAYDLTNIKPLCHKCHMEEHKRLRKIPFEKIYDLEKFDWHKVRPKEVQDKVDCGYKPTFRKKHVRKLNRKIQKTKKSVSGSVIKDIKYVGYEDCYDLETESGNHNYVANKIVVHNSQRYQEVQDFEPIELRKQGETNRQVGDEVFDPDLVTDIVTSNFEYSNVEKASEAVERVLSDVSNLYNKLIEAGVARECARMILPMASQSTLYFKGSVRSWLHYLELRTKQDTQKEHREVAEACKKIFIDKFPIISEALGWK